MNPSFLVKAFPAFMLMFHQKAIFCYRNEELGSMVVLAQSKQSLSIAPLHCNSNQGAQLTSLRPCAEEGAQYYPCPSCLPCEEKELPPTGSAHVFGC